MTNEQGNASQNDPYDREEEETATEEGMPLLPNRDDANQPIDDEQGED